MKKSRITALFSGIVILSIIAGCGNDTSPSNTVSEVKNVNETVSEAEDKEQEEIKQKYSYELPDLEGYSFRYMNITDDMWGSDIGKIDFEEMTGDSVQDEQYLRNRRVEADLNVNFAPIVKYEVFDLAEQIKKTVLAAEPAFDAAYICATNYAAAVPYTMNFYDLNKINVNEPWWNKSYLESMTIGNSYIYAVTDCVSTWSRIRQGAIFFNKDMAINLGITLPYDDARDGKWTFDRMYEMIKQAVNLNGDSDFYPRVNGICIYGHAANHSEAPLNIMQGSGLYLVEKDQNNIPVLVEDFTAYIDMFDKYSAMNRTEGNNVLINTAELIGDTIFMQGRSMFMTEPVIAVTGTSMRALEFEYGVMPLPKYNESQARYYSPVSPYSLLSCIPLNAPEPDITGIVLDYMNWIGYTEITPVLMETMCYKGVRDEDSIDMLEIILNSTSADIGHLWGITKDTQEKIAMLAADGSEEIASVLEKSISRNQKSLDKMLAEVLGD